MNRRQQALALARRFRTCPTPDATGLPATHPRMAAHRRRCPLCAEVGVEDAWQPIARRVAELVAGKKDGAIPDLAPGHLVAVKPERARWIGDLFYHPPLVVVLAGCPTLPEAVQVAQVYDDTLLAGPEDLIIEDPQSPFGPFFIECWNRYTLRRQDLGPPLIKLSARHLEAAIAMARDPSAAPLWAPLPVPISDETDPRLAFRRLEVEVGYVFAGEAAGELMAGIGPADFPLAPAREITEDLSRLIPGIRWHGRPGASDEILSTAVLPDGFYPLAAAGEGFAILGRRIDLERGRPARIFPIVPRVDHVAPLGEALVGVSGRIDPPPDEACPSRLLATYSLPGQAPAVCPTVNWDPVSGLFYAEAPVGEIRRLRIEVTLMVEAPDD